MGNKGRKQKINKKQQQQQREDRRKNDDKRRRDDSKRSEETLGKREPHPTLAWRVIRRANVNLTLASLTWFAIRRYLGQTWTLLYLGLMCDLLTDLFPRTVCYQIHESSQTCRQGCSPSDKTTCRSCILRLKEPKRTNHNVSIWKPAGCTQYFVCLSLCVSCFFRFVFFICRLSV